MEFSLRINLKQNFGWVQIVRQAGREDKVERNKGWNAEGRDKQGQNIFKPQYLQFTDSIMDYPQLYSQLPKEPIKWTVTDIQVWLHFIGLSSLNDKFKELSIDGSCLGSLTEEDLRGELGIKSGITIKKVMSWITKGLSEYQQFLKSPMAGASEIDYSEIKEITQKANTKNPQLPEQPRQIFHQSSFKSVPGDAVKSSFPVPLQKVSSASEFLNQSESMMDDQDGQKRKEYQLIIQQCDGPQTSFYSVKEEGAKIGRHSSNQILILDESISRFHAEIKFEDGVFYLKDTSSTTGTFIKIHEKIQIIPEMIVEMGSNQFQAHFLDGVLTLEVIEGPSQGSLMEIPKNNKVTIGRKQTNAINFPDDQHLSNIHATIFSLDNKYYIEDMGTTNGSWKRLSLEGEASVFEELTDKLVFKFGSSSTYTCKVKTAYVSDKTSPNACIICYQNDKDCVYMPCKHNTACIKCSKNLRECPICRIKIEDFVRIYKS